MSTLAQGLSDLLTGGGSGKRETALTDASMAAAALVATAAGDVTFAERAVLDQAIHALSERGAAEPHEAVATFEDYVEAIRDNSSQGRRPALIAIEKLEKAADAVTVVLRIAKAVAAAGGPASPAEIEALRDVAAALAIDAEDQA